ARRLLMREFAVEKILTLKFSPSGMFFKRTKSHGGSSPLGSEELSSGRSPLEIYYLLYKLIVKQSVFCMKYHHEVSSKYIITQSMIEREMMIGAIGETM